MITTEMHQEVLTKVKETLTILGHEDLIPIILVQWKKSFTRRMGDALYASKEERVRKTAEKFRSPTGVIVRVRFSIPLFSRATVAQRNQTVVHEVCHIVSLHEAHLAGKTISVHGKEWKTLMLMVGANPKRCHEVDTLGLGKKVIQGKCSCKTHSLTPLQAGKILYQNSAFRCRKCKNQILIDSENLTQEQIKDCTNAWNNKVGKRVFTLFLENRNSAS